MAEHDLSKLQDYPFHGPPSQLREPNRSAANDWLLEHAPWLWAKPRIRVYVSMKTGKLAFGQLRSHNLILVEEAMHVG